MIALSDKKTKTVKFLNWRERGDSRYVIESVHGDMVKLKGIPELVPKSELDRDSIKTD